MTKQPKSNIFFPARGSNSQRSGKNDNQESSQLVKPSFWHRIVGWLAVSVFRSSLIKRGPRLHHWTMKMLQTSANNNYLPALTLAGQLLAHKGETDAGRRLGFKYLNQAAWLGDIHSQFAIAEVYANEQTLLAEYDINKAIYWYKKAATEHPLAPKRLVDIFNSNLQGVDLDQEDIAFWQQKAENNIDLK